MDFNHFFPGETISDLLASVGLRPPTPPAPATSPPVSMLLTPPDSSPNSSLSQMPLHNHQPFQPPSFRNNNNLAQLEVKLAEISDMIKAQNAIAEYEARLAELTNVVKMLMVGRGPAPLPSRSSGSISPVSPGPRNYICNICSNPGHLIKECPQARAKTESYTPYQGTKRCFGEFRCERCRRSWTSGNSWANSAQACKKCQTPIFPYRQASLEKPSNLIGSGIVTTTTLPRRQEFSSPPMYQ